ncbi:M91 family zinc metallopeptidase [Serinicoccus sp. CNJ-927]|uniref:M91 family zinc metallopeptidase n=1 Tax=Serinicoccus sp. CNJ-927 TaxID=1904970 RepID=UPI00117AFFCF|nr:M91 family zinc metallopeptidase [Serinicoccus sp. CNJ-927]
MGSTTVTDLWTFPVDLGWLADATARTHAIASTLDGTWADVGRGITSLECSWSCARADSYLGYAVDLRSALTSATGGASLLSEATRVLQERLEEARDELGLSWLAARVGSTHAVRSGGEATFTWEDEEPEPPAIARQRAVAERALDEARSAVGRFVSAVHAATAELAPVATAWSGPAGGSPGWDVPRGGASGVTVTQHGNGVVINSGDHADQVDISADPSTGETLVVVNGQTYRYPRGVSITVNTGGGGDHITIEDTVPNRIRLVVGDGDDTVTADESGNHLEVYANGGHDTVQTGSGVDYVSGGTGHDYADTGMGDDFVAGGAGNDVLYGMDGDDAVIGGSGQDYLEGARGDDVVLGVDGDDIVSGGRDDDVLVGGGGDDSMYAGLGQDGLDGGAGQDSTFHTDGDTVTGSEGGEEVVIEDRAWDETFDISGDDSFEARAEADLDMLNSSPTSQALIDELTRHAEEQGRTYGIDETDGGNSASWGGSVNYNDTNLLISGDASKPWYENGRPPTIGLYHELGHLNQYEQPDAWERWKDENGDSYTDDQDQPLLERQNVGLEWDHDDDDSTNEAIDPDHDYRFTENAVREEWGLPHREKY